MSGLELKGIGGQLMDTAQCYRNVHNLRRDCDQFGGGTHCDPLINEPKIRLSKGEANGGPAKGKINSEEHGARNASIPTAPLWPSGSGSKCCDARKAAGPAPGRCGGAGSDRRRGSRRVARGVQAIAPRRFRILTLPVGQPCIHQAAACNRSRT